MNLILLGGPGSGKGTQAKVIKTRFGLLHVSTGNLFRQNIREGTPLGKEADSFISKGLLVPDDLTVAMLGRTLEQPEAAAGVVLDGFPRTLPQARALSGLLEALGRSLNAVLSIRVSDDEIVRRLSGRLICSECQSTFHKIFSPFKVCPFDKCEGEYLYRREDDEPETIRARLKVFQNMTAPLVEFYEQAGLLVPVDGEGPIELVSERLLSAIEKLA